MKVTVKKLDDANVLVSGTIENSVIEANVSKLAIEAGKQMKVDGFRKGKVPAHVVKKLHGDKLKQDAESDALKSLMDLGVIHSHEPVAAFGRQFFFQCFVYITHSLSLPPKYGLIKSKKPSDCTSTVWKRQPYFPQTQEHRGTANTIFPAFRWFPKVVYAG